MHQLSIKFPSDIDKENLYHTFWSVLGAMRQNGQLTGREMQPYLLDDTMSALVASVGEGGLNPKYYNKYVTHHIEELEKICGKKLKVKFLGFRENEEKALCTCEKPAYFLLHFYKDYSPIVCGSCDKAYPLYRLPKLEDFSYWRISSWQSAYQGCVLLDLNCGTGEKWAMKEQCDPNSGLSIQGRKVTIKIEAETGIKTYYFLSNFSKKSKAIDINRPCPGCGDEWHLDTEIHGYIKHKCDKCLLMSAYSNNHS